MSRRRRKLTAFVDSVVATSERVLQAAGMGEDQARVASNEIARQICSQYGRTYMYVPLTLAWDVTERDQQLYDAYAKPGPDGVRPFTQDRVDQLATEFTVTPGYVYTIVRMVQAQRQRDRQPALPGIEQPS